jgi:HPt (histidine-containing phosphotransfer) domain-containing protein
MPRTYGIGAARADARVTGDTATLAAPAAMPRPPAMHGITMDVERLLVDLDGDHELAAELAQLFLEEAPRWLAQIRDALAVGALADVRIAAHKMRGSLATLRAEEARRAALALEKAPDVAEAAAACAALADVLRPVWPEVRALAAGQGAVGATQRASTA